MVFSSGRFSRPTAAVEGTGLPILQPPISYCENVSVHLSEHVSRLYEELWDVYLVFVMLLFCRSNVLFHMMSFVQFPVILSKIIQQHGTYRFDEFKQACFLAHVMKLAISCCLFFS